MNLNNIIRLASEIKELRDRANKLEIELGKELTTAKSAFPTNFSKKKEDHEEKYAPPPGAFFPTYDSGKYPPWDPGRVLKEIKDKIVLKL